MESGWLGFALLSAVFAGLTAVLAKLGVSQVSSTLATGVRTAVIALLMAITLSWRKEWSGLGAIPQRAWVYLVLSALTTGLSWLCYYHALKLGPASRVAPIDKLSVVVAMGLAALFLGEHPSPQVWGGGLLIFSGAMLIALA